MQMRSGSIPIRLWAVPFLLSAAVAFSAENAPTLSPAPQGEEPARDFRVRVNGEEIFVHTCEAAAFASFAFGAGNGAPVEVEIAPRHDVKWLDIRPLSRNIRHTLRDNIIRFALEKPCVLSVELNNESTRPLYLFADAPETNVPDPADPAVRRFRAGFVHEPGEIRMKSGETVCIEAGAVVRGHIVAEDAKGIRILGRGILDGGPFTVRPPGSDSVSYAHTKRRMIDLVRCSDVSIEGITILNSQTWTVVPQFCRDVRITGIRQVCWAFGSDGVDIVGSSGVTVDGCFMRNNDDNIAIKTWGGSEKYPRQAERGPDVERVRVENCTFWNMAWGNALEIGFELRAGFVRDVAFRNCDVIHTERGAVFSIHNGDCATVENIRYENIRVEDARHKLIDLAVFQSQYSADRPADPAERKNRYLDGAWDGVLRVPPEERAGAAAHRGRIRNILFKDIAVTDGRPPFSILSGFDAGHAVEDVTIENLRFHGRKIRDAEDGKFVIENAKGVRFR